MTAGEQRLRTASAPTSSSAGSRRAQQLRLDRMRDAYGVGIGTLREILSRLAAEGLVLAEGQRGFEAPPVSAARACASSRTSGCCSSGTRWPSRSPPATSSGRGGSSPRTTSSRWSRRRMIAGRQSEAPAWKRYDSEFHQALISACGSRTLMQAHANGFDRYLRYLMVAACFRGEVAADEHRRAARLRARPRHGGGGPGAREAYRRLRRAGPRQDALIAHAAATPTSDTCRRRVAAHAWRRTS